MILRQNCLTCFKRQWPMWRLSEEASLLLYVGICIRIRALFFFPSFLLTESYFFEYSFDSFH